MYKLKFLKLTFNFSKKLFLIILIILKQNNSKFFILAKQITRFLNLSGLSLKEMDKLLK